MASQSPAEAQEKLSYTLDEFFQLQGTIRGRYEGVQAKMQRLNSEGQDFVIEDEKQLSLMKKMSYEAPSITVVGETNSGKTSLVNELLGNSHLPACQKQNTGRTVVVKYSESNYYKVINSRGAVIDSGRFEKEVPKHLIALEGASRESETAKATVEVGLKKTILRGGLQIKDLPGLGESNMMDKLISQCVDGVLQIVIYVIDAKNSVRDTELLHLKTLRDNNVDFYVVCNKIEHDTTAERFDAFDDETPSYGSGHAQAKEQEKIQTTRNKLLYGPRGRLLSSSQVHTRFHPLSLKKVRLARAKKRTDDYTKNFSRFIDTISEEIEACIQKDMKLAKELVVGFENYVNDPTNVVPAKRANRDRRVATRNTDGALSTSMAAMSLRVREEEAHGRVRQWFVLQTMQIFDSDSDSD